MHLHLDPLGGVSGDMFAASLLHAVPDALADIQRAVSTAAGVACNTAAHNDGTLTGLRFTVEDAHHHHHHHHHHTHWSDIRARLSDTLDGPTRSHAFAIFQHLADAEAQIHGTTPDEVAFHEVGAVDSIADIVAAAILITRLAPTSVSIAPLPLGSGRVETAHGIMPVPAPATALLLRGFETIDDGIAGERITPTGAAILRHLAPTPRSRTQQRLVASGYGFGTRRLPGISNCLRATLFETTQFDTHVPHRTLAVIAFEVDDQSGEDLAAGIERIRAHAAVHDVVQIPAIGKKGRFAVQLQVLADNTRTDEVVDLCFRETTTIGLRIQHTEARALVRHATEVTANGRPVRLKIVDRPGGQTAKPEADDLAHAGDAAARAALRTQALHAQAPERQE